MEVQSKYERVRLDFDKYINVIVKYYDVTREQVLKSNQESCVDARYCLVYLLCDKYTDYELSKGCALSKSCVNKIRNKFKDKLCLNSFKLDFMEIKNLIERNNC
jgi:hypothetical protein